MKYLSCRSYPLMFFVLDHVSPPFPNVSPFHGGPIDPAEVERCRFSEMDLGLGGEDLGMAEWLHFMLLRVLWRWGRWGLLQRGVIKKMGRNKTRLTDIDICVYIYYMLIYIYIC